MSTHQGQVFLKSSADKLPVSNDRRLKFIFSNYSYEIYMLCLCHYGLALLTFWFQTDFGRENSASFFLNIGGEDLFLPMVTRWSLSTSIFYALIGQNLTKEFMRKILCSILKVVYLDSWSWQRFVSTCNVLNYPFPLDVQNEIPVVWRVFCYSWLVCLLGFWSRNASLVKFR